MKDRLKQLRKMLGLKQREVAERLGVIPSLIGKWESGQQELPKTRIYQICNEYHVRREWLVDGQGEMFETEREPIDEDEAQRRFVLKCFEELQPETQQIVLDAMRQYLDATPRAKPPEPSPSTAPEEILVADIERRDDQRDA